MPPPPTPLEISIPTTTLSPDSSKPFTLYNIHLRLPLRTFTIQKRYSEFASLHSTLTTTHGVPPAPFPSKSWFKSTTSSPELLESRRHDLETYLKTINTCPDRKWRDTAAWRAFLNLPSGSVGGAGGDKGREEAHRKITEVKGETLGEREWLDVLRECKGNVHDARLELGKRDIAGTAKAQFEAGAEAKRFLTRAGGLVRTLEEALKVNAVTNGGGGGGGGAAKGKSGEGWRLGEGEMRRRRDLVEAVRGDISGLEKLAASLAGKVNQSASGGSGTATVQDKSALFGPGVTAPRGRVLGAPVPETDKTRELDNQGVLMLQKQMMRDQDLDVNELAKIVRRQKEMGLAINEELVLQNEMLSRVDEDVDRVKGKIDIARKRVGKIK